MATDPELFLAHLERVFGKEDVLRQVGPARPGRPPISLFIWRNLPEPGLITGVTYGLSVVGHPEWRAARPELMVSVESEDEAWPLAAAFFADQFAGERTFSYESLFTLDRPIASDSEMSAFFTFAPPLAEAADGRVELNRFEIQLVGMYPLYPGEVELIQKMGLSAFWNEESYDPFSVTRPDRSKAVS